MFGFSISFILVLFWGILCPIQSRTLQASIKETFMNSPDIKFNPHQRHDRSVKPIYIERIPESEERPALPNKPNQAPSFCRRGFYCGTQLARMGYQNTHPNTLYECSTEQNALYFQKCPHGYDCVEDGFESYCKCRPGMQYCGYELRLYNYFLPPNSDHSLFFCNSAQEPRKIETCPIRCLINNTGDSVCTRRPGPAQCHPHSKYCGLELTALKLSIGWAPQVLYECTEENDFSLSEWCSNGCVADQSSFCRVGLAPVKPRRAGLG